MVDTWVKTWPVDGDRPARKTLRYALGGDTLIQVQVTGVIGGKRTNYEIPGVGHHDPIPMGAKIGNIFYSSGIAGVEPEAGGHRIEAVEDLEGQIAYCQSGFQSLIEQAGGTLDDIVLVTVLIQDFAIIPAVQRHWDVLYPDKTNRPALKFIDYRMPTRNHVQHHVTAVIP
jgi:enamine deaminase RidA (YjgF/YER057c/UK114 family)